MATDRPRRPDARRAAASGVAVAVSCVGVALLAVAAFRADLTAYPGRYADAAVDAVVGLVFVVAAGLATGSLRQRVLIGSVGPLWLAASLAAWATSLPLAVLLLALLAFPAARWDGLARVVLAVGAVAAAVRAVPEDWLPALWALAAATTAASPRPRASTPSRWYPPIAAGLVAGVLLLLAWQRSAGVPASIGAYAAVLLGVAVGFPVATRADDLARRRRTAAAADTEGGLEGLVAVLRRSLDDPQLEVVLDPAEGTVPVARTVTLHDADGARVLVAGRGDWATDPRTVEGLERALRLTLTNISLRAEQQQKLMLVTASRSRLLTVIDDERARATRELALRADPPLAAAAERLASVDVAPGSEVAALLGTARDELLAARSQVGELVAGAPPARLGAGALRDVLRDLVLAAPLDATVEVGPDVAADQPVETTLFYVCSECIANTVKHASATRLDVRLELVDGALALTVADDGRGGADVLGAGLRGLADRVAARGGLLAIESPVGGGTRVVAVVPVRDRHDHPAMHDAGTAGASTVA